ncbi:hypothetical protein [Agriterribacter humi]|uniref:hypothetical protein n=1 Tax=Agriterribacter humi TaxID=1104781 RepID=UPI001264ED4A|nr:hypothetical protein [Agriterribacter humi]
MDRRGFLKLTSVGSAGITTEQWWGGDGNIMSAAQADDKASDVMIDPIVPIRFFTNRKDKILQQLIELKKVYGLKRFLFAAPMEDIRLTGFPGREVYQQIGGTILEAKQALRSYGISIGWWCAPSIRSGYDSRFQYITDLSGFVSDSSPCPLDHLFKEEFSNNIALVVNIARPFVVQFEDDFELSWQPNWRPPNVNFGCFCPLHLAEFSKRQGRLFKREELLELFKKSDDATVDLRRSWAELSRDSLAGFAKLIREKVDKVAPETRISLCQAGVSDFDGDFTESVTRAFAGNTRPMVRLYGSSYSSDEPVSLPGSIFHALYSRQHLPADIECLHESDTYPHTRFFMSAAKLRSFMTAAFAYGFNDSLLYATQYLDNLLEESGYLEMFKREVKRFSKIKEEVANAPVAGCEIVHLPFAHTAVPYRSGTPGAPQNPWISVLGRFGIPYTSKNGKVKVVSGASLKIMNDEEIKTLLHSAVLLDGYAAYILSQKGYGKWIGAAIAPGKDPNFCFEGIRNISMHKNLKGELMYNLIFFPGSSSEGGIFYELNPDPKAEIITDFLDPEEKPVIPGFIRFENEWGGRVAITAFDLHQNKSSAVFNYKKKELLRETIEWLGKEQLPVFINDHPNVFCICNKSDSGKYLIVTAINLSSDGADSLSIHVPTGWENAFVFQLQTQGNWMPVSPKRFGRTMKLNATFNLMEPVVLKITK